MFSSSVHGWTQDYAEIKIFRPKQFQGGAVIFQVIVNDETIARISNGSRVTYRVYSEGPIEIKLKASVYNSKSINFGVISGEKYYIKAGFDDAIGSKLTFIQLSENNGERQFNDGNLYHRQNIKVIEEDKGKPVVQTTTILTEEEPEFETVAGNEPEIAWMNPRTDNAATDIEVFAIDACIRSDAEKIDVRLIHNGTELQSLEDIPSHKNQKCSLTLLSNVTLQNGPNTIEVIVKDEFGESMSRRTIQYNRKKEETKKRLALVIGNSGYAHITPLPNPVNDAKAMSAALEKLGFKVLKYENLNHNAMKRAIGEFGIALDDYDVGLFYYAGHGVQYDGINYLVPVDANVGSEDEIEYECVNAGRVLSKMEMMKTGVNIIILDACRNNPFKFAASRSMSAPGLTGMDAPAGSIVAYATAPGKTASDGLGKNGLYTEELLSYIFRPDLKVEDLFKQVRINVMKKTNNRQIPWETSSLTGDFYFTKETLNNKK